MPIPKGKENLWVKIKGHLNNIGYSDEVAKDKADKAIKDRPAKKKVRRRGSKAAY